MLLPRDLHRAFLTEHAGRRDRLVLAVLLAVVLVLGAAREVRGQPRGEMGLWAEQRYERWGPFGELRTWEGTLLHADGHFFPVNAGAWSFWVDAAERGQEFQLQGRAIPTAYGRLGIDLGDYSAFEPRRDALRLEFQNRVWVRGASAHIDRGVAGFGFRAGKLTENPSAFGWGRRTLPASLFGLSAWGRWHGEGMWKLDWDRQQGIEGRQSGRHVVAGYLGKEPDEGFAWLSQTRISVEDGTANWGGSVIVGGAYAAQTMAVRGHVRRISPAFRGLGVRADGHRNEWGWRLETHAYPQPSLRIGGSVDFARDIETRAFNMTPENRIFTRLWGNANLYGPLYLQTYLTYRNRNTQDLDSLLVDQNTWAGSGTLGFRRAGSQADLSYRRGIQRDPSTLNGDWHENTLRLRGQQQFGKMRGEALVEYSQRRRPDGAFLARERRAELRAYWDRTDRQRGWVWTARDVQDADLEEYRRDLWEFGAGWEQPLPWALLVRAEAFFFVPVGGGNVDERMRTNLRVGRRFSFGGGRVLDEGQLPEYGTVLGVAFEDRNANGVRDQGEPGVSGLTLKLGSGPSMTTGPHGTYQFDNAAPQMETLALELSSLPARYLSPEVSRTTLRLAPGELVTVDFPIRAASMVRGRVVRRERGGTVGVPDVLLQIPGTHHDVFTDSQGRFVIGGLEPGLTEVRVVEWSIGERLEPREEAARHVILVPGDRIELEDIVLVSKPVASIKVFGSGP